MVEIEEEEKKDSCHSKPPIVRAIRRKILVSVIERGPLGYQIMKESEEKNACRIQKFHKNNAYKKNLPHHF